MTRALQNSFDSKRVRLLRFITDSRNTAHIYAKRCEGPDIMVDPRSQNIARVRIPGPLNVPRPHLADSARCRWVSPQSALSFIFTTRKPDFSVQCVHCSRPVPAADFKRPPPAVRHFIFAGRRRFNDVINDVTGCCGWWGG